MALVPLSMHCPPSPQSAAELQTFLHAPRAQIRPPEQSLFW
jgi:hypothetical protein